MCVCVNKQLGSITFVTQTRNDEKKMIKDMYNKSQNKSHIYRTQTYTQLGKTKPNAV